MPLFSWFRRRPQRGGDTAAQGARAGFAMRGGRLHLRGIPYVLPKDGSEMSRLDFQHFMLRAALRGNFAAPITAPTSILDVGSGTGRWAREVAEVFPQAQIVGLDILAPQADEAADAGIGPDLRPPNYTYIQGNVLEGLPFEDARFDFTHQRLLLGALPAARWPGVVRELVRVTRPNGWVELVECYVLEGGAAATRAIVQWNIEMCERRGIDNLIAPKIRGFLSDAGLANVTERKVTLPVGRYGGRIGAMAETDYTTLMSATRPVVIGMGIASAEAYDAALAGMRNEITRGRCEWSFHIVYGQRLF